jgi:hypothetical protein
MISSRTGSPKTGQLKPFGHCAQAIADNGNIKANSIAEWIATLSVQIFIESHFLHFLLSSTDEAGTSVYGNHIKDLGKST